MLYCYSVTRTYDLTVSKRDILSFCAFTIIPFLYLYHLRFIHLSSRRVKNDPFFIRTWVPRRVTAFVQEKNGTESCRYICVIHHYLQNYDLCSSEATFFCHRHRCILPLKCTVTLIPFYRSHHILFSLNMRFIFSMSMGSFVPWGKKHYLNLRWPTYTMRS